MFIPDSRVWGQESCPFDPSWAAYIKSIHLWTFRLLCPCRFFVQYSPSEALCKASRLLELVLCWLQVSQVSDIEPLAPPPPAPATWHVMGWVSPAFLCNAHLQKLCARLLDSSSWSCVGYKFHKHQILSRRPHRPPQPRYRALRPNYSTCDGVG